MGLKGKEGEQILWCCCASCSKSVPVVIPKGTGAEPWLFLCSRSWVPAGLLNTKMKFHTVSLEWKQHDVSVERVEQYVKGNRTERREQLTPGAEQICSLCFTGWVCFQLRTSWVSKHSSTAPQLWAGKWNNCKESVPSSWNKLRSLWEMKAKAELQNKLEVLRCRSAEWNHSIESDLEQSPEKNPAVMTNPFLMCVVVGKITSLKDHFSLCIGYSSLPSF